MNESLKFKRTYATWWGMISRCNPRYANDRRGKNYASRGIKVCKRWHKFSNFLADMGERPEGKELDRKNTNGNYSKRNCRWTTRFVNIHNSRHVIHDDLEYTPMSRQRKYQIRRQRRLAA